MTRAEKFLSELPKGRCNPCEYAKCINAQRGCMYIGCFCKPYEGKWVATIKKCPMGKKERRAFND